MSCRCWRTSWRGHPGHRVVCLGTNAFNQDNVVQYRINAFPVLLLGFFFFLTAQISNCEKSAWPQAANWALWIQLAVHRPLLHCSDWRHSTGCRSSFISSVHQRLSDVLKQSSDRTDPVFTVKAAFYYVSIFLMEVHYAPQRLRREAAFYGLIF